MTKSEALSDMLDRHKAVFSGFVKGLKADIKIKDGAQPVFHKARPVPYALRQRVEE